jgi:hypothetical protein
MFPGRLPLGFFLALPAPDFELWARDPSKQALVDKLWRITGFEKLNPQKSMVKVSLIQIVALPAPFSGRRLTRLSFRRAEADQAADHCTADQH